MGLMGWIRTVYANVPESEGNGVRLETQFNSKL